MKQFPKFTPKSKRRGVTEIISTLMLLAITVTGASVLTYFVNECTTLTKGGCSMANREKLF